MLLHNGGNGLNILIVNVDSKIKNLALAKIEKYHINKGDVIKFDLPIYRSWADKIYVSVIFTWNKWKAEQWVSDKSTIGGSGWDLKTNLPEEIEKIHPHINCGFTTRGCIRNCKFCVVPTKEGKIHAVADVYDIWDGNSKNITLMDNNILAMPDHFEKICKQLIKEKLRVDFNQGLDARLLNNDNVRLLSKIKHKEYHFAWDNIQDEKIIKNAIKLLRENGINRSSWYVLSGFNTTFDEDLYKANELKTLNQNVYLMRYETVKNKREYIDLARWCNQPRFFQAMSFDKYKSLLRSK